MNDASSIKNPWADLFSRLVGYGLPMVYFLVTVSFYLRTYDSAQIKITLTQIGGALVLLLWALQLLFERRWPWKRADWPLVAPFAALLLSGAVSYAQSSFRAGSLDDFIRRFLYVGMALVAVTEFRGMDRHRRLLRWLLAAFAVVVGYGVVQYVDSRLFPQGVGVGIDPFVWRMAFNQRVFSSFGNPNFFGNFLVIITPILLSISLRNRGGVYRPYLLLAVLAPSFYLADRLFVGHFGGADASTRLPLSLALGVCLIAAGVVVFYRSPSARATGMLLFFGGTFLNLYATETKGAWVGFVVALVAVSGLIGYFFIGHGGRRIPKTLMAVTLATGVVGMGLVGMYAKQRIQSVSFRVFTWIATFEMIRQQPILGSGIGTFKWSYPAFRRPEIILLEGKSNTETDHAEDEYLEIWYDEGVAGMGIFLWLLVSISALGIMALRRLTARGEGGPADFDERAYYLTGYLGAWWGALGHWFMDVSVRFVSSGIFSFFLPGLVASLIRNEKGGAVQDPPSPLAPFARRALVLFWTGVFLTLTGRNRVFPVLYWQTYLWTRQSWWDIVPLLKGLYPVYLGMGLFVLTEILERENRSSVGFGGETALGWLRRGAGGITRSRWMGAAVLTAAWGYGFFVFQGYFRADVNHNLGIYFSKSNIWARAPEFEPLAGKLGPEMSDEYKRVGGALEHYERTLTLNPAYPMATYFIGNVYNDWGSSAASRALDLRQKGDVGAAESDRARAEGLWEKSLEAYARLKKFAPNYVQVHHQEGLVHLKRADLRRLWNPGTPVATEEDEALRCFDLYNKLDPVYPQNYYRQAYIYSLRGDDDRAVAALNGALKYNTANVVNRVYDDRNIETYAALGKIWTGRFYRAHPGQTLFPEDVNFKKAEESYLRILEILRNQPEQSVAAGFEPAKELAILYTRVGRRVQAESLWRQLRAVRPDDPDVKRVFAPSP
jgi:tetratricopeptide (TPR) repeat protein/O-antigen ligase